MAVRGIRNRNPLNLRPLPGGDTWQGQTGVDKAADATGAGYCVFADWAYGIRAGAKNLLVYQRKYNLRTLKAIISRWAPPGDNNHTQAYIDRVSRLTGTSEDYPLDLEQYQTIGPLIDAMARVELGIGDTGALPYTEAEKLQGLELAGLDVPQAGVRTAPARDPVRTGTGVTVTTAAATGGVILTTIADNKEEIIAGIEASDGVSDLAGEVWAPLAGVVVVLVAILVIVKVIRRKREREV